MGNQVFIHIGGEKTGTTTLQRFLTQNASRLMRQGFYYPSEPDQNIFSHIAHFPIAASLIDQKVEFIGKDRRQTLHLVPGELERTVAATRFATILSCEHFSSRLTQVQQLKTLRNLMPANEIKIVYYLREPSDLALAFWSTVILCGGRKPFDSRSVTPANPYYNHLQTLDLWGSVFGESNLIVREYKRSALNNGDICKDFCALLGIQTAGMQFEKDANQSLDMQRLEVLRYLNLALPAFHECEDKWLLAENIRRVVSSYIPEGGQLDMLLSDEDRNLIKSRFYSINQQINEKYFGGRLSPDWFPDTRACPKKTDTPALTDDIAAILRETIIRLATNNEGHCESLRYAQPTKKRKLHRYFKRLRQASRKFLDITSTMSERHNS